jgi:CheY-like chemotaxis protein
MDFDSGLPDFVGIESEIREALTNLIINAVDALPNGGTITIRTHSIERKPKRNKNGAMNFAIVDVVDTGVGMDEETRRRCLEPFFSTKGRHGTGLGLAMVYGVVERHEGDIEIESEPGKGTTIRLLFPVRAIAASDTTDFQRNGKTPSLRILCIDDEPLVRELIKEMLEHDGHKVETTDGGETGLSAFRSARDADKPFDVVITDLGMPNLDGRQVAAIMKRESPELPVIMLTGWGALIKEEGTQTPNVDAVLNKPPKLNEIQDTLRRVTRRKGSRK